MGQALAIPLAIAQTGIGVAGAFAQQRQAQSQAAAEKRAAARQTHAVYHEVSRQEVEVNRIAAEQTSDRVRAADAELGAAKVAAAERGVSGSTMTAMARHIGYLEGADLSRIETNRSKNIAAGEQSKKNAKQGYYESVTIADNQASAATTGAWLNAAGSGLQIAGNYFNTQQQLGAMQNTRVT